MWVREFGLLVQHAGVITCRSIGDGCIITTAICCRPSITVVLPSDWVVSAVWSVDIHLFAMTIGRHQAHKRRSSRHRKRDQQSTSSVFHTPSGLSANRRRAVDDKEGHLIYSDGDVLHSRCTQAFVYLLIRRR